VAEVPLRPQPFLAHWAPGAILAAITLFGINGPSGERLIWAMLSRLGATTFVLLFVLGSFAVGQVLDAIRDGLFEDVLDWEPRRGNGRLSQTLRWLGFRPVKWDFFVVGDDDAVNRLEVWFYSHYMLTFDLALGLILLLTLPWWRVYPGAMPNLPPQLKWWLLAASVVLLYDALRLPVTRRSPLSR
jgi:hypothetical protein